MNIKNQTLGLGALIFQSNNPDRLAAFYKEVLGLPLELNSHGELYSHWECDFNNIHFAILKTNEILNGNGVIPSFVVKDILKLINDHNLSLNDEILHLGDGKYVGWLNDPDGNRIHLWMDKSQQD
ncbi:VOC family protein [Sphingobacterium endophyticum]|uniref:VOC family protein n=1 Tax=Sphingobacterium endophyticum TaxID=2546448 RepID=UPI0012E1BAA2|nr:VOC family protein [Sphingobacterium endophyticum]